MGIYVHNTKRLRIPPVSIFKLNPLSTRSLNHRNLQVFFSARRVLISDRQLNIRVSHDRPPQVIINLHPLQSLPIQVNIDILR